MPGTTIRRTTTGTGLSGTGVYVFPSGPLPRLRADPQRPAVCIVAPFGWGPANTLWRVTSGTDLLARHMPVMNGDIYLSIANLPFRELYVVRALGGSSAAAALTSDSAAAADSIVATAKHHGALGNSLKVAYSANATTSTSRDATVTLVANGITVYEKLWPAVQVANGTVTDPGDPYVTFTKASGATAQVAVTAAASLSGGSDGTLTAALFRTALEAASGPNNRVGIVCFAGVDTGLCDDLNTSLADWLADEDHGVGKLGIGPTPGARAADDTITEVAAYDQERMVRLWPRVRRFAAYNYAGQSQSGTGSSAVCGGAAMASFIQGCDPWEAPMMSVISDKQLNGSILGLETAYENTGLTTYGLMEDAGVTPWFHHNDFGVVPKASQTTRVNFGVPETIEERRYIQLLEDNIARYDEAYLGKALDLDLANARLGKVTSRNVRAISAFLAKEEKEGRLIPGLNDDGTDSPAYLVDPFSASTAENLAIGRWDKVISCRITPSMRQIVIHSTMGRSVNIHTQIVG